MTSALEEGLQTCERMISPELLKRCGLYRRNETESPERCWDDEVRRCPNHTGKLRGVPYVALDARKMRTMPLYRLDHGGSFFGDSKVLESEDPEQGEVDSP